MTIFSLFAAFMGTFAWFEAARSKTTGSDGFGVYAGSSLNIVSAYAVRYDGNLGATATSLLGQNVPDIAMSEYDYIFKDRNVNTPLFIRLEITGFDTNKDLKINIHCTGGLTTVKTKNGNNYTVRDNQLSNVVGAKFLTGLKVNGNTVKDNKNFAVPSQIKDCYDGMLEMGRGNGSQTYVGAYEGGKRNDIEMTLASGVVFAPSMLIGDNAIVYLKLDYFVEGAVNLVDDYIHSYDGKPVEYSTAFLHDITSISLSNG